MKIVNFGLLQKIFVLQHSNFSVACRVLDADENGIRKVYNLDGEQNILYVNESAVGFDC
ncbi:MAG: hypothetical protein QM487_13860 [Candidatus Marithrix sp.]